MSWSPGGEPKELRKKSRRRCDKSVKMREKEKLVDAARRVEVVDETETTILMKS